LCRPTNAKGVGLYIAFIVPDVGKTLYYIFLELSTIFLRIVLFFKTKNFFAETTIVADTPKAQKKKQEERNVSCKNNFFFYAQQNNGY